jgi:UDP-N-acetylmuramoylalanine--D-glutamate ligase
MTQRVAVLGFGVTGESVVRHLLRQGKEPVVLDTRPARQVELADVQFYWEANHWPKLDVSSAVVSPGLPLDSCLVAGARAAGVELKSDIDLFFDAVQSPVVGVTGTNGKSTVTSLAGHLLKTAGVSCGVGGNLGEAALDILDPDHECYVLELSSFQLERSAEHSYRAATVLNVSEDHLDKHLDMSAYIQSKHRIYAASECCVYNRMDDLTVPAHPDDAPSFGPDRPPTEADWGIRDESGKRALVHGGHEICSVSELSVTGAHNEQNALAACALVSSWVPDAALRSGLGSFAGLAHRFEIVAEIDGVVFVNDSKATNLGATIAALAGMPADNQVVLIAGGDAKGVDLSPLLPFFQGRVKLLVTIGKDGPQLSSLAAGARISVSQAKDMTEAVAAAKRMATSGDTVLLSPACASLDMYSNFAQRGNQFAAAVTGGGAV